MVSEADYRVPLETGGILLGAWRSDREVLITTAVGPGPRAVHTDTNFDPDYAYHEKVAVEHWRSTAQAEYYLGDWHTHPSGGAYLSPKDRKALQHIDRMGNLCGPALMVVLGNGRQWQLLVWAQPKTMLGSLFRMPTRCALVVTR